MITIPTTNKFIAEILLWTGVTVCVFRDMSSAKMSRAVYWSS